MINLKKHIVDEITENQEKKDEYFFYLSFSSKFFSGNDEYDKALMLSNIIYSIINYSDDENYKRNIWENFEKISTIKFSDKLNETSSGITIFKEDKHIIYLDQSLMLNDEQFIRTLIHELIHVASCNIVDNKLVSGIIYDGLNSSNEALTVFFEGDITKNFFDIPIKTNEISIPLDFINYIKINTSLDGYDNIAEYSKVFLSIEGYEKIFNLTFKVGEYLEDDSLYINDLKLFKETYENIDKALDYLKNYNRVSDSFSCKDYYMKINNEICNIIKEKIDNGLNVSDYLIMTNSLKENFNINITVEKINSRQVSFMDNIVGNLDLYYFSNLVKNELYGYIDSDKLCEKLVYDRLNCGYGSYNIVKTFNEFRNLINDNKVGFVDGTINKLILKKYKGLNKLNDKNKDSISEDYYQKQLLTNYLSFVEGNTISEKCFKLLLDEDLNNKQEVQNIINKEFSYYSKNSKKYNKYFLMDIVKKCNNSDYFEIFIEGIADKNMQWYKELLTSPCNIFNEENKMVEVSPLEYALNNSKPEMFVTMLNHLKEPLEHVKLTNINEVCSNIGNLYSKNPFDVSYKNYLDQRFLDEGYKSILDFVKIDKDDIYRENNVDALASLVVDFKQRNTENLEYNLNKLCELGYSSDIIDTRGRNLKEELEKAKQYEIILNNSDFGIKNSSNLNFNISKEEAQQYLAKIIAKDYKKFDYYESNYPKIIDYNLVIEECLKKDEYKYIINDIFLNEERNKDIDVASACFAYSRFYSIGKFNYANKMLDFMEQHFDLQNNYENARNISLFLFLIKDEDTLFKFLKNDKHTILFEDVLNCFVYKIDSFSIDDLVSFHRIFKEGLNRETFDLIEDGNDISILEHDVSFNSLQLFIANGKQEAALEILKTYNAIDLFGLKDGDNAVEKIDYLIDLNRDFGNNYDISIKLKNIKNDYLYSKLFEEKLKEYENKINLKIERTNKEFVNNNKFIIKDIENKEEKIEMDL